LKPLERFIEWVLTTGLLLSALLLVLGLATGSTRALSFGIVALMLTPVSRVIVVTLGLLWKRDWIFGALSLFVLLVLLCGIGVAAGFAVGHSTR
jgi:uncharacterized membrane protein